MKIGIIGAGRFGKNHVRVLSELGYLAGIAELDETTRNSASEQYKVPAFADYRELIKSGIDGVVIATPAHTHFPIAKDVLELGLPVMVEKPITLNSKDAEVLNELAKAKKLPLMVGHLLLFQPAIVKAKELIQSGDIGQLLSLHQERLNLGKARAQENALWSLGVHDVAVLLYLVGKAPLQNSFVGQATLTEGVEDDTYLHMNFENGVKAHVHNSWLWPELRRRLTVIGSKGMLIFDEQTTELTLYRKSIDSDLNNQDQGSEVIHSGTSNPLAIELEHFADCIRTGQTPITDGDSALAVIRILEASK
jgi:predicted dehydrogenase